MEQQKKYPKKPYLIAGLGEVLWDIYDDGKRIGGAPANFAAHVKMLGEGSVLLSRVGADGMGDELLAELQSLGVDVSAVQRDPQKPTGTVRVQLDREGKPHFTCSHDVAFDALFYDECWSSIAKKVDAVLFGTLAQRSAISRMAIQSFLSQASQACKIFDLNLRGWDEQTSEIVKRGLAICQILKMNQEELEHLQKVYAGPQDRIQFARHIIRSFAIDLVAITLGENGCILITASEMAMHPGFRIKVVDTTGCGDAFAAGLVVAYLRKEPLAHIAEFANRLGAFVAGQQGAVPKCSPMIFSI